MSTIPNCPICIKYDERKIFDYDIQIKCKRCGDYKLLKFIDTNYLKDLNGLQRANLSGWIRENQRESITAEDIENHKDIFTPSISEKADKLLIYLSKKYPIPGQDILSTNEIYSAKIHQKKFLGVTWSQNLDELKFILGEYLSKEKQFINEIRSATEPLKITPKGWAYLDSLRKINLDSQIGFIAMWFDPRLDSVFKAIEKGIENAQYRPERIDKKEHNNRIDDEIMASIKKSRFVVSDFTGNRGGVYFEAGYALGLGIEVIWLVREKALHRVHFDNRQYNFITWKCEKENDLNVLSRNLQHRIERTIGIGSYKRKDTE